MDVTADGPKVSFETSGFSAYAIVQGSTNSLGYVKIKDLADLNDHLTLGNGKPRPFFIEHIDGCFFRNEQMNNVNNTTGRTGIYKTKPASKDNPPAGAAAYYFEYTGSGDKYYIYCFDSDGNKQYLCNNANNSISFVSSRRNLGMDYFGINR